MRLSSTFRLLPFLLVASLASLGACADSDDGPPKMVSVANETGAVHRVQFGTTDFATVAPAAMSDYREVGDGEQIVRVDGREVARQTLGTDNVGGSWTLHLQAVGAQLLVGVTSDD